MNQGKKRNSFGLRNGMTKLEEEQVLEVRKSPLPSRELSVLYGVAPRTIRDIKSGETWRWLIEK